MNNLMRIMGLVGVVAAAGCSHGFFGDVVDFVDDTTEDVVDYVAPVDHYTVVIDSSLTLKQKEIFLQAVDDWKMVLGDKASFKIVFADFDHGISPKTGEILVYGVVKPPGVTAAGMTQPTRLKTPWKFTDSKKPIKAKIWLDKTKEDAKLFKMICQHEIGHALGLQHNEDPRSVLHWILPSAEKNVITCSDASALCDIWGCKPDNCLY